MSSGDILDNAANSPRNVAGDQGSVQTHSLGDMIEYDKYKRQKDIVDNPDPGNGGSGGGAFGGIRFSKCRHPGTV